MRAYVYSHTNMQNIYFKNMELIHSGVHIPPKVSNCWTRATADGASAEPCAVVLCLPGWNLAPMRDPLALSQILRYVYNASQFTQHT